MSLDKQLSLGISEYFPQIGSARASFLRYAINIAPVNLNFKRCANPLAICMLRFALANNLIPPQKPSIQCMCWKFIEKM